MIVRGGSVYQDVSVVTPTLRGANSDFIGDHEVLLRYSGLRFTLSCDREPDYVFGKFRRFDPTSPTRPL